MWAFAGLTLRATRELYIITLSVRRATCAGNIYVCDNVSASLDDTWHCGGGWLCRAPQVSATLGFSCEGSPGRTAALGRATRASRAELPKSWKLRAPSCPLSKQTELHNAANLTEVQTERRGKASVLTDIVEFGSGVRFAFADSRQQERVIGELKRRVTALARVQRTLHLSPQLTWFSGSRCSCLYRFTHHKRFYVHHCVSLAGKSSTKT